MRTRAVRDGDDYVVTGQKIWTSHAEVADYCELLVRTGPEDSRHRGISWLILPMDSPGRRHPPAPHHRRLHRVRRAVPRRGPGARGQPGGRGERRLAGHHGHPQLRTGHRLRRRPARGRRAAVDAPSPWPGAPGPGPTPASAARPATCEAELDALWALTKRNVSQAARTGIPGVGGTYFKLAYSETRHKLGEFSPRAARPGRPGRPRPRGRRRSRRARRPAPWSRTGCGGSRSPSPRAPRRSSATSSASGSSGCPRSPRPRPRAEGLNRGLRGLRVPVRAGRRDPPAVRGPVPARVDPRRARATERVVDRAGWKELGDAGVFHLCLAEEAGGVGLGLAEAAARLRGARPGPRARAAGRLPPGRRTRRRGRRRDRWWSASSSAPAPGPSAPASYRSSSSTSPTSTSCWCCPTRASSGSTRRALAADPPPPPHGPADPGLVGGGPSRRRAAGRARRGRLVAPRRGRAHGRPPGGHGPVGLRPGGGVRQGAGPVRSAHRRVPGRQAPVRRHGRPGRGGPDRRAGGRGHRRPARRGRRPGGRGRGQAAGRRGGRDQRPVVHPGPRGHGVHVGGPGPPGLQAGPGPRHHLRDRRRPGRGAGGLPGPPGPS